MSGSVSMGANKIAFPEDHQKQKKYRSHYSWSKLFQDEIANLQIKAKFW